MPYRYEFSICAIFKNEAAILKQWIEHHLLFGCEHFYLINNDSQDDSGSVLFPYIQCGLVDLVDEPGKYRQSYAYSEHYLETICRDTRWIGIIDIDEYLYPRRDGGDIKQVLDNCRGIDALAVPWLTYGSSGLINQPENIIDSFVFRQNYDHTGWTSFKTVARTNALAWSTIENPDSLDDYVLWIHSFRLKPGKIFVPAFLPVDTRLLGEPLPYCYHFKEANLESAQLVINHYRTMSLEYHRQVKTKRPSACTPAYDLGEEDMAYFNEYDTNDIEDGSLKYFTQILLENRSLQ